MIDAAALPQEQAPARQSRRRPWLRRGAVAAGVLILIGLIHAPLLRGLAGLLVTTPSSMTPRYVWICAGDDAVCDGDRAVQVAAQYCRRQPQGRVLIVDRLPSRAVELHAWPSFEILVRRNLHQAGLPDADVELAGGNANSAWENARRMGDWLGRHPGDDVLLLCDELNSACWHYVIDRTLAPDLARRIGIRPLRNRLYDPTNWWRRRDGIKGVLYAGLAYAFTRWSGEGCDVRPADCQDYEGRLRARLQELQR